MSSLPRLSVGQPVLVNLLMVGIIVGGFFALLDMPQELNPNVSFNWVFVTIPYPGASPAEVEDLIIIPAEEEVDKIDRIDELLSTAGEGWGFLWIKFEEMSKHDFTAAMQDVRMHIDQANLPGDIEDPIIEDFGSDDFAPVISVGITFSSDEDVAADIADDLADDIEHIADVAKVQISGLEDREIWVEVDPFQLAAQNLTLSSVVGALAARNINLPGGNVTIGRSEYLVRAVSRYESPEEIRETVLFSAPDGRIVRLGDVARVRAVRAEQTVLARLNGTRSITISVSKKAGGSTYALADEVKALVAEYETRSPAGIEYTITMDSTEMISEILGVLRNNALFGIVFIFAILLTFLGLGNALLASMGIPLSFLITFILMSLTGQTVNGSSLFALIIVLGIIVDDAIIVIENVHSHRQRGKPLRQAVIEGTEEVLGPVTSGILTTIAAFLPLMLLPGIMGKFMRVIPMVVSLALLASLFEATTILPAHIHDWTRKATHHTKPEMRFYVWLRDRYERGLRALLQRRYWVLGATVLLMALSTMAIPLVGIELFGEENLDFFTVLVKLPEGSSLEETDRVIERIEAAALELPAEDLRYVVANAGLYQGNDEWTTRKSVGQVVVTLKPAAERVRSIDEMIALLRERVSDISGMTSLQFQKPSGGPPTGKPISIRVAGKHLDELESAAADLKEVLGTVAGVHDIGDDFPRGKKEILIKVDEERAALLGFSPQQISLELRTAIEGVTATTFREGDEDIDVIVKLADSKQQSLEDIGSLKLTSLHGGSVPVKDLAEITVRDGASEIKHRNLTRTIMVTAELDDEIVSLDEAVAQARRHFDRIAARYQDVQFEMGGEFEEFTTAFNNIAMLFGVGVLLIYLILGTQFRSYIQPIIILLTVPLAFIGAMVGLLINGDRFSIVTLFGIVALAGIVVNDSIVLIAFINNARLRGQDRWESIVAGGRQRLRPIILTSVTTIGGLLPTAIGLGGSSSVWRPLASTIAYGLLFSTILTLFVIPAFLAIVDDVKKRTGASLMPRKE